MKDFFLARYIAQGKVDIHTNGCWLWNRGKNQKGYGLVKINGSMRPVHRLVLGEKLGRAVRSGMDACHKCHTPSCVNPDHLYEGTRRQNVQDMIDAGRAGQRARYRSDDFLLEVRKSLLKGESQSSIAARLNVNKSTISRINTGKTWNTQGNIHPVATGGSKWNNPLSKEEIELIVNARNIEGKSYEAIAKEVNRSKTTVIRAYKKCI